jgi:hypothetical protein
MAALPLLTQSEGLHLPIQPQPQPQRPAPPRQTQLDVARPAELVTCDQTIERSVGRLKQFRRVATRYDKRAVNYLAWVTLAAALIWPMTLTGSPRGVCDALRMGRRCSHRPRPVWDARLRTERGAARPCLILQPDFVI